MTTDLARLRDSIELITFDCYGTLIVWNRGIAETLGRLSGRTGDDTVELVNAYIRHEAAIEQQAYRSYRSIQAETLRLLAATYDFRLPQDKADALSESLPDWPTFPDTNAALTRLKGRCKLGILSNIDRDLLEATCRQFEVEFDIVVTAQDVHAYKPAHAHFVRMLEQSGVPREAVLHAAQSLYHDAAPAAQLGLQFAWINRYGQSRPAQTPMLGEFTSLEALAEVMGV